MNDVLLRAETLGRLIKDTWIWRGVDLGLRAGEQLAIVGPTGSGKSLLLRCLASLDAADEGNLDFDGRPLAAWTLPDYRSRVVYLHQRPALWEGTVEDNLRAIFELAAHRSRQYDRDRAVACLRAFDRAASFLHKSTAELSGGEQQITALVRALGIEPSILLLDEPSASMDTTVTRQVEELIAGWVRESPHRAAVWTSHDPDQVGRVASCMLTLDGAAGAVWGTTPGAAARTASGATSETALGTAGGTAA